MKNMFSLVLLLFSFAAVAQQNTLNIIPAPVQAEVKSGTYAFNKDAISISTNGNSSFNFAAEYLAKKLGAMGKKINVTNGANADINFSLLKNDTKIGNEGYYLDVAENGINIKANTPAGILYGIHSLMQMLPAQIASRDVVTGADWKIPAASIMDYPRLGWRGLMLDVSRHFFTVDEVKQYIDAMVPFKFNLLHWHLTDDEGWRIEIKSYPNLTKKGAWNVRKVGNFGTFSKPEPNEPRDYGGFYTQEQIKDIVQYAKQRNIDIMPEVDVPGHSLATIASYPELSCTPAADKYQVRSGEQFMDWSKGPPPIAFLDNTLCPANEKVYVFRP